MSILREVLVRIRTAPPGTSLDDIARGLGMMRDELDAMVEYWVHRGELVIDELNSCSSGGCGSCHSSRNDACHRPASRSASRSGPVLTAIRPTRDRAAGSARSDSPS